MRRWRPGVGQVRARPFCPPSKPCRPNMSRDVFATIHEASLVVASGRYNVKNRHVEGKIRISQQRRAWLRQKRNSGEREENMNERQVTAARAGW